MCPLLTAAPALLALRWLLLLCHRVVNAEEALRIGLVNAVLPKAELDAHVESTALSMAKLSPLTIEAAKMSIDGHAGAARAYDRCYESHDYKEGVLAFLQKRSPVFEGR